MVHAEVFERLRSHAKNDDLVAFWAQVKEPNNARIVADIESNHDDESGELGETYGAFQALVFCVLQKREASFSATCSVATARSPSTCITANSWLGRCNQST